MATTESGRAELFGRRMIEDMSVTIDETIGGLALMVLAILALAKIDVVLLDAIAIIVAGIALMIVSAGLGIELNRLLGERTGHAAQVSGLNAGVLGGIAAIVLGILALLDIAAPTLIAVALIVLGAAVLFDFVAMVQVRTLRMLPVEMPEQSSRLTMSVVSSSSTAVVLAAVAVITLGILALAGIASDILVSVALLGLGAYLFLEGSAVVARMLLWTTP